MKRNPSKAHATKKGHVPNSKPEGVQPRPRGLVQKDKNTPGIYGKVGGFHKPKEPIKAGKLTTKDRRGVAKGPRPKGKP